MGEIGFEYPWLFALLLLYPVCARWCRPRFESLWFPGGDRLAKMAGARTSLKGALKFLAFALMVTALASPVKRDEISIHHDKGYEISLILDASGSMAQNGKFDIV